MRRVLVLICSFGLILAVCYAEPKQRPTVREVQLAELVDGRVQVAGLLKLPIGTVAEFGCKFEPDESANMKSLNPGFVRVVSIDGQELPKGSRPRFPMDQVLEFQPNMKQKIAKSKTFTCRGFEGLATIGIPADAIDEKNPIEVTKPWNYYTMLTIVELTKN